jgi:hypothetical protein
MLYIELAIVVALILLNACGQKIETVEKTMSCPFSA